MSHTKVPVKPMVCWRHHHEDCDECDAARAKLAEQIKVFGGDETKAVLMIAAAKAIAFKEGERAAEARIVAWLKVTPHIGGRLAHIKDNNLIARIAEAIERGEHR